MEQFPNHELEYVVDDYYDVTDFEDDNNPPRSGSSSIDDDSVDSDFEDDLEFVSPFFRVSENSVYLFISAENLISFLFFGLKYL